MLDRIVITLLAMIPLGVVLAVLLHPAFIILTLVPLGLVCLAYVALEKAVNGLTFD